MTTHKIKHLHNNSIHSKILHILEKSNKIMSVEEITKKVLQYYSLSGKTPHKTISSTLQRSIFVKKVGRGLYKIK